MGVIDFWVKSNSVGSRSSVRTVGNTVNLLVHLSTMMVTVLTGTGAGEADVSRVP